MTEDRQSLKIVSDQRMQTLNENHLFEGLQLTKPTEEDYNEYLDPSLNRFISSQPYLQRPEDSEEGSTVRQEEP